MARTPGWVGLRPIQRIVTATDPVASRAAFTGSLTTWHDPSFLAPLGHLVSADAPAGVIDRLIEPARPPRTGGSAEPLPVVHRPRALGRVVQRLRTALWPVATVAPGGPAGTSGDLPAEDSPAPGPSPATVQSPPVPSPQRSLPCAPEPHALRRIAPTAGSDPAAGGIAASGTTELTRSRGPSAIPMLDLPVVARAPSTGGKALPDDTLMGPKAAAAHPAGSGAGPLVPPLAPRPPLGTGGGHDAPPPPGRPATENPPTSGRPAAEGPQTGEAPTADIALVGDRAPGPQGSVLPVAGLRQAHTATSGSPAPTQGLGAPLPPGSLRVQRARRGTTDGPAVILGGPQPFASPPAARAVPTAATPDATHDSDRIFEPAYEAPASDARPVVPAATVEALGRLPAAPAVDSGAVPRNRAAAPPPVARLVGDRTAPMSDVRMTPPEPRESPLSPGHDAGPRPLQRWSAGWSGWRGTDEANPGPSGIDATPGPHGTPLPSAPATRATSSPVAADAPPSPPSMLPLSMLPVAALAASAVPGSAVPASAIPTSAVRVSRLLASTQPVSTQPVSTQPVSTHSVSAYPVSAYPVSAYQASTPRGSIQPLAGPSIAGTTGPRSALRAADLPPLQLSAGPPVALSPHPLVAQGGFPLARRPDAPAGPVAGTGPIAVTAPPKLSESPALIPGPVPVLRTVTSPTSQAALPTAADPHAQAGLDHPPTPTSEELARTLFDPLLRRLKAELRLDRERRGALTDLRH